MKFQAVWVHLLVPKTKSCGMAIPTYVFKDATYGSGDTDMLALFWTKPRWMDEGLITKKTVQRLSRGKAESNQERLLGRP